MADPVVRLDVTHLTLSPGVPGQVGVSIASTSAIVERFTLELLGEPAHWATVSPDAFDVYPGTDAQSVITFAPPSGRAAPSGVLSFGVLVRSATDPTSSAVAEGQLELGAVAGLRATLVPVNSTGRWSGRHLVQLANWGNTPAQLHVVAHDPDELLGFYVHPNVVDLAVGASADVRLKVRARRPFLTGPVRRVPFQVVGVPSDQIGAPPPDQPYGNPARPVVDGALNQRPIVSQGLIVLLGVLVVAALAGGAWVWTKSRAGSSTPPAQSTSQTASGAEPTSATSPTSVPPTSPTTSPTSASSLTTGPATTESSGPPPSTSMSPTQTTARSSTSPPVPTGTPTAIVKVPDGTIVLVATWGPSDGLPTYLAKAVQLQGAQVNGQVLFSGDYRKVEIAGQTLSNADLVVSLPYGSEAAAQADCTRMRTAIPDAQCVALTLTAS